MDMPSKFQCMLYIATFNTEQFFSFKSHKTPFTICVMRILVLWEPCLHWLSLCCLFNVFRPTRMQKQSRAIFFIGSSGGFEPYLVHRKTSAKTQTDNLFVESRASGLLSKTWQEKVNFCLLRKFQKTLKALEGCRPYKYKRKRRIMASIATVVIFVKLTSGLKTKFSFKGDRMIVSPGKYKKTRRIFNPF